MREFAGSIIGRGDEGEVRERLETLETELLRGSPFMVGPFYINCKIPYRSET